MNVKDVLQHLENRFDGRMVLYVDDIAKILGQSEKAVANLIACKGLPFKVKLVAGQLCVDILQVAIWLVSDEEMALQSVAKADTSPTQPKRRSGKKSTPSAPTPTASNEPPVLTGEMAAQLLSMRRSRASAMQRLIHRLKDTDELAFMSEVVERLFYAVDELPSSYVVTLSKRALKGAKLRFEESRKYFETEDQAGDFLMRKLIGWRFRKGGLKNVLVEHFVLEREGCPLFHAIASEGNLVLLNNAIGFEFPGGL